MQPYFPRHLFTILVSKATNMPNLPTRSLTCTGEPGWKPSATAGCRQYATTSAASRTTTTSSTKKLLISIFDFRCIGLISSSPLGSYKSASTSSSSCPTTPTPFHSSSSSIQFPISYAEYCPTCGDERRTKCNRC